MQPSVPVIDAADEELHRAIRFFEEGKVSKHQLTHFQYSAQADRNYKPVVFVSIALTQHSFWLRWDVEVYTRSLCFLAFTVADAGALRTRIVL